MNLFIFKLLYYYEKTYQTYLIICTVVYAYVQMNVR